MTRKLAQDRGENGISDFGLGVMGEEEENKDFDGISQDLADTLNRSLRTASDGIEKGINMDLASKRAQYSIFNDIAEVVTAPINMTLPSRQLERSVKDQMSMFKPNKNINNDAFNIFSKKILSPSKNLYNSGFRPFIDVISRIDKVSSSEKNDTSNIFRLIDSLSNASFAETPMSSDSPYKIILNKIIPVLREKFDAVASFDKTIGSGDKIDHEGVSQRLLEGMEDSEDTSVLESFYKAIVEWRDILNRLDSLSLGSSGISEPKGDIQSKPSDKPSEDKKNTISEKTKEGIYIKGVRTGQYAVFDSQTGEVTVDEKALAQGFTPVLKVIISGPEAGSVNSEGSGEDYFNHFIKNKKIILSKTLRRIDLIENITRETVPDGAELSIYLKPFGLMAAKSSSPNRLDVMTIVSPGARISVYADDAGIVSDLRKHSSAETSPYYEAKSPSGEYVRFTPADLVISGGKLKDSKGKAFKPTKIRGKSLAGKVQSKSYGKVRK
tara:strand:- start:115 stop:1602 length:1488 start_codon:yes stop_codon:yes gene_type:complete